MLQKFCLLLITGCLFFFAHAQTKTINAVRVQTAPKLDGKLDDAVWQNVSAATDFIIKNPTFGNASVQRT